MKVLYKEGYTIVFDCPKGNASAKFKVYEVTTVTDEENPIYYYRYKDGYTDGTDYNESEPEYQGFIKWDGCLDLHLSTHFCGYRNALEIKDVITDLYQLASEEIEGFDNDLADFNNG